MDQLVDHDLNKRILNVLTYKAAYYEGWEAGINFSVIVKEIQQGDTTVSNVKVRSKVELQQLIDNLQDNSYVIQFDSPFCNTEPFRVGCVESVNDVLMALISHEKTPDTPDNSIPRFAQRTSFRRYFIGGKAWGFNWVVEQNADITAINHDIEWLQKSLPEHPEKGSHTMFRAGRLEALIESVDLIDQVKLGISMPELDMPDAYNDLD